MKNLAELRRKIVERHQDRLDKVQSKILELMTNSITDKKTNGGGGINLGFLKAFNANAQFNKESSIGMDSHDRLEYSKLWFEQLKAMRETIVNDPGYQKEMEDIDEQMELYRKELERIDEEYENAVKAEDEAMRKILSEKREKHWTMAK